MITDEAYQAVLERCLRLEHDNAVLRGMHITPLLPRIERRSLPDAHVPAAPQFGQTYRRVTPDDIAQMRALRERNVSYHEIGQRCGFSTQTALRYTMDVLDEREVGG